MAEIMSPLSTGVEGSANRIAQYGQGGFVEGLPELLKVLQDVAAVHPFIARESLAPLISICH